MKATVLPMPAAFRSIENKSFPSGVTQRIYGTPPAILECKESDLNITQVSGAGLPSITSGASARMSPQQKMTNLFEQMDTAGSGSITKDQLSAAFDTLNPPASFRNAGVDAVYSKLDPNGNGLVSKPDFVTGMKSLMVSLRASTDSLNSLGS